MESGEALIKKRILHIVPLLGVNAEYGGPSRGTLRQASVSQSGSNSAEILALWSGAKPASKAGDVILTTFKARRIPVDSKFAGLYSLAAIAWLARKARRFDLVHVHAGRELWVLLCMCILRLLRVPYVVQTHGMLGPRDEFRIRAYDTLLTQHAYKGARLAFYLTNTEKRELSALGWIVQLRALYNAVDPIADEAAVRSAEPLRIVTISRIHHRKYIGDLVEAVAIAKSHGLDCRLEIYGPDEGDLAAVRNAIHDHDVDDCVHYGGPLQYDQVPSELNANDVFVLPSRREPFPNALLEALASGRPTLSTTECGLAPHIQNFKAGVVVKPGPHNLALGILEIAGFSSEEWHTMGSNAIALCRAKFSLAYLSEELASAYESILSE